MQSMYLCLMASLLVVGMAGTVTDAYSEEDIHSFLAAHAEGVGVIYYHDGDDTDDMDMINRFAELTDVLSIDSTDP